MPKNIHRKHPKEPALQRFMANSMFAYRGQNAQLSEEADHISPNQQNAQLKEAVLRDARMAGLINEDQGGKELYELLFELGFEWRFVADAEASMFVRTVKPKLED